jgi:hypothetical protein
MGRFGVFVVGAVIGALMFIPDVFAAALLVILAIFAYGAFKAGAK